MKVFVLFIVMSNSPRVTTFKEEFKTLVACKNAAIELAKLGNDSGLHSKALCLEVER